MYGDFNFSGGPFDGATTKTRNIYEVLKERYDDVDYFNIEGWRKNPFKKIFELKKYTKHTDVIVFIPGARNGTYFAINYLTKLKHKKNVKLYYFIAGSLLPIYLKDKPKYIKKIKQIDAIFCETNGLIHELKEFGIENLYLSCTFDLRGECDFSPKKQEKENEYRFCSFSRVNREKGLGISIDAINHINNLGKIKIFYDIYGKLDENFKEEMEQKISNSNGQIRYLGLIPDENVISTLSKYDANIFATFFKGECLPATVIESLKACTPVIISDWKYNREVIEHDKEGFVFGNSTDDLIKMIMEKCSQSNPFENMRYNCYLKSKKYSRDECLKDLFKLIG